MPNSFTVFPNVLPGNVTIGGNLTVGGDQVRIGAAAPFVRVGKDAGGQLMLSENIGFDGAAIDSAGTAAFWQSLRALSNEERLIRFNTAGTRQDSAFSATIFTDYTAHTNTGNTTENQIYSKLIPANTLGANGGWDMVFRVNPTIAGAGSSQLRIKFNGVAALVLTFSAVFNAFVRVRVRNKNAGNSNDMFMTFEGISGTVPAAQFVANVNADYTVDQTLSITMQSANAGDSQALDSMSIHQQNSFGPV